MIIKLSDIIDAKKSEFKMILICLQKPSEMDGKYHENTMLTQK